MQKREERFVNASFHCADAYVCTVKGSENASGRMLWLLSRPACNSAFDEDEDKGKDEDDYNRWGEFDHDYEYRVTQKNVT